MISDISLWELLEKQYNGHNYSCPTDAESFEVAYEQTVWRSGDKPTLDELIAKKAAYDEANAPYKLSRKDAYPAIGDQLDALYHAGVFPDDMAAQIQAVKEEYPKP